VLPGEATLINTHALIVSEPLLDGAGACPEEELSRHDNFLSLDIEVFESLAEKGFGLTEAVELGCVEKVNAVIDRPLHTIGHELLLVLMAYDGYHVSKREGGDLKACSSQVSIDHLGLLFFYHMLILENL
jgi:hypothetical protein